ncbi:DUF4013 domain-containing protein [Halorubrum sp. ASP1]|jgi:hypothetical protein|uniref:DUF4013 domain-containing protein n=1 Tax=Halorubrum sp. ASP1 TaxID=2518114 RepID=UPI0010F4AF93|nr:DUF4013 domain-containing protein [Halorubrum sp. ASP1]TKX60630.1 DUF4013 domain-containing protein [Halorubrum sp. ASP1]
MVDNTPQTPPEYQARGQSVSPTAGFTYVFQQEQWRQTIAIGALLTALSVTLVPTILIAGYGWRVTAHAQRDAPPPVFNDWGRLFIEGCRAIIALILPSISIIVGTSLVWLTARFAVFGYLPLELDSMPALSTWVIGALLTGFLGLYLTPAGFVNAVRDNSLLSACSPSILISTISPSYLLLWVIAFSTATGLVLTSLIFSLIPVVGVILGAASTFYSVIALVALFAFGLR